MAIEIAFSSCAATPARKYNGIVFLFLAIVTAFTYLIPQSAEADYVFSAPPRESLEDGEKFYGPIANALSALLGVPVTYKHPGGWMKYTLGMRAGQYDIVFDGPHFVAWRMKHVGHIPLVRLDGKLQFYVMAKKSDLKGKSMRSVIGREVCGLASPNLGTVSVFAMYDNPVMQPVIRRVSGGFKAIMKKFLQGECDYAVVRDKLFKKLPQAQKDVINIIGRSTPWPNQTISVTQKISKADRNKIVKFLTSKQGKAAAGKLLGRFSKKKPYFIPVKTKEYRDLELLLEGVVWGW